MDAEQRGRKVVGMARSPEGEVTPAGDGPLARGRRHWVWLRRVAITILICIPLFLFLACLLAAFVSNLFSGAMEGKVGSEYEVARTRACRALDQVHEHLLGHPSIEGDFQRVRTLVEAGQVKCRAEIPNVSGSDRLRALYSRAVGVCSSVTELSTIAESGEILALALDAVDACRLTAYDH